ncbi:MAG TPA: glycoside hydrolase family 2 TIM barrel-domain containing protein, partial [Bacteroidales bacterium]|nr:glycoside hydrolase family 2 TIM barrel-domain containing protein [Bacteroidales bacterium]
MKYFAFVLLVLMTFSCKTYNRKAESSVDTLSVGWKMQPRDKLNGIEGNTISENGFDASSWFDAEVPGTVLGSLVSDSVVKDPYFGINMQNVDPEQFKQPWWFRSTFSLSPDDLKKKISLRFSGINYRADLWINGKKVVGKDKFAGTYRMFTFNIDKYVVPGQNTIALELWQHADGEYSIGFVDWNPLPRDRSMGIFRDVFLEINDGLKIRSPFVYSKVDTVEENAADLFIQTEVVNSTDKPVKGIMQVDYQLGIVRKQVTVGPGDTLSCQFSPSEFPQLSVKNVKLWWPNGMGRPDMYNMKAEFITGGKILDRVGKRYGIREITSYLDERKNRAFRINGKFILLKGGGWTDDLLLQDTKESVEDQLRYVRHMNLNSIRCEGFWGKDETLYNLCDEYGIMVMVGWNCHWEWEDYLLKPVDEKYGGPVSKEDIDLISAYWFDQMMWLRNHPSIY